MPAFFLVAVTRLRCLHNDQSGKSSARLHRAVDGAGQSGMIALPRDQASETSTSVDVRIACE